MVTGTGPGGSDLNCNGNTCHHTLCETYLSALITDQKCCLCAHSCLAELPFSPHVEAMHVWNGGMQYKCGLASPLGGHVAERTSSD
jgi:hypothetical protein